jgi:imidazolonepropionase-like amidohydrolase
VLVRGDRIVAIGPAERLGRPAGAEVVDGRGKYLIPGLWDMHTHVVAYGAKAFPLLVANGVTTIRETGGSPPDKALALRALARSTPEPAPRVLVAGPTLDAPWMVRPGFGRWPIATPEAARRAVDSLATLGVDFVKVHSATPRAAYFAVLDRARAEGLLVAGHIPDSVAPAEAIRAGHRTIEHDWRIPAAMSREGDRLSAEMLAGMQAALEAGGDQPKLWPVVQRRIAADSLGRESFDSATAAAFGRLAAGAEVWFDPTLMVLLTQARRNEVAVRQPPELRFVPPEGLEFEDGLPPKENPTDEDIAAGRRAYAEALRTMRVLVAAGARFVAGTDTPVLPLVPGFALQGELEQLVAIGLSPAQAIAAGSGNAAAAMGRAADLGTIADGKVADLVLLAADPLADIRNTRQITAVILRGRLLDRTALDGLLTRAEAQGARAH